MNKAMQQFADALASKDAGRYCRWFAEDVKLYTPVHEEPSVGREAACRILSVVFSLLDGFHYPDVFTGPGDTHALVFRAQVKGVPLEGVDYVQVGDGGLVTEFSVTMRPLKAITTLAKEIGAVLRQGQADGGGGAAAAPPEQE